MNSKYTFLRMHVEENVCFPCPTGGWSRMQVKSRIYRTIRLSSKKKKSRLRKNIIQRRKGVLVMKNINSFIVLQS